MKGTAKNTAEEIIYIICKSCGSLYTSNKCTSCLGCTFKSGCLDDMESKNTKIQGQCPCCIERSIQQVAA